MRRLVYSSIIHESKRRLDVITEAWLGYQELPARRALEQLTLDLAADYCGRCGQSVGRGEATLDGCGSCSGGAATADAVIRLSEYGGRMRQWIHQVKYHRAVELALELGRHLGRQVRNEAHVNLDRSIIVPMPMPARRRLLRGIDHGRVLAQGAAEELGLEVPSILMRANGPPQATLPASTRRRRGGVGLSLRRRLGQWRLTDLEVILIDDVLTTGASMRAAVRAIRSTGANRVIAAVVAVAPDPARRPRGGEPGDA